MRTSWARVSKPAASWSLPNPVAVARVSRAEMLRRNSPPTAMLRARARSMLARSACRRCWVTKACKPMPEATARGKMAPNASRNKRRWSGTRRAESAVDMEGDFKSVATDGHMIVKLSDPS